MVHCEHIDTIDDFNEAGVACVVLFVVCLCFVYLCRVPCKNLNNKVHSHAKKCLYVAVY